MKTLKELEIIKRSVKDKDTPFSMFGIECDYGWNTIIVEALNKMEELDDKDSYITQIKEKFGELRIYTSSYKESIERQLEQIIEEAEIKASETCEVCGAKGTLRTKGWISVRCDKCAR